jgi:hypothetical protein
MDVQQLKQLAGRLRALLEEASIAIGHSQALDLSASLVGLRNWPEVQTFPQRVRSQDLDLSTAARLAYRLDRKHSHPISLCQNRIFLRHGFVSTPIRVQLPSQVLGVAPAAYWLRYPVLYGALRADLENCLF